MKHGWIDFSGTFSQDVEKQGQLRIPDVTRNENVGPGICFSDLSRHVQTQNWRHLELLIHSFAIVIEGGAQWSMGKTRNMIPSKNINTRDSRITVD